MFDKNISGELPEHMDFIKNKCIPLFESWGYPVKILHADLTYMDIFLRQPTRGKHFGSGKITGFPMSGKCQINRSIKVLPIKNFLKNFDDDFVQYIGIASDELKRLERLTENKFSLLQKYNVTEKESYELCKKYHLLSPIYNFSDRGGCWFCPNTKEKELYNLYLNHSDLWKKLMELENNKSLVNCYFNAFKKMRIHDWNDWFEEEEKERVFLIGEKEV